MSRHVLEYRGFCAFTDTELALEMWKPIDEVPHYHVSTLGRVKNSFTNHILHLQKRKSGYVKVNLYKDGIEYTRDVHRLVAKAFIPNPNNLPEVNHDNGHKDDNRVGNLYWCTQKENVRHAMRTGLLTPKAPEPVRAPVRIIETGEVFPSITDCAKAIGSSVINIVYAMDDRIPDHHSCKGLHFERVTREEYDNMTRIKKQPFLYDFQMEAIKHAFNGCVFNGQVGSGKSRTGLFYYFQSQGGWIDENGYVPMKNPKDLFIITTAMKRDKAEWNGELIPFQMYPKPELNRYDNKITIDSWNNIKKYVDVKDAFFIFDEQKVCGSGAWVKSFLKITKNNDWILLSATVGDTWLDYVPLFIANGFYKNRTDFIRQHIEYDPYCKNFPKIKQYHNTGRLIRLRDKILIDMDFKRPTVQHHEDVYCSYDIPMYKDAIRNRWDPFKDEPIQQASGLCYVLRKIVNSDESRQIKLLELLEDHPKAIIFYNHDYERDILLGLGYGDGTEIAEWSGHAHQPIPTGDKWVYIVNYLSGAEGWNSIATDTIIFYSQNYSYKIMTQAAGRIDRMNTKFVDLHYYHLKSRSGIDLAITKAIREKKVFNEGRYVERSKMWSTRDKNNFSNGTVTAVVSRFDKF